MRTVSLGVCLLSLMLYTPWVHGQSTTHFDKSSASVSGTDSTSDVAVVVGKSVLVDFAEPIKRMAIGLPEIAEATAISPSEMMINGKTPGQTSLIVWNKSGSRQFFTVTVHANNFEARDRLNAVRRELAKELTGQQVQVSVENGSIFLRGTVRDLDSAARAVQIASTALASSKAGAAGHDAKDSGQVVNLLYVQVPKAEKQILLKVRFAAIDRSKAKQLGINMFSLGAGGTVGGVTTGQFTAPTIAGGSSSSTGVSSGGYSATFSDELNGLLFFPDLGVGADLKALESNGVAQILAEPNLVAANGQQASFLAGGEYPFPVAQGGSSGTSITIQWKEYGVRLTFIPTITPRGTIRLQVSPEVSALDTADSVSVDGYEVPALTVRRVKTEAELSSNQSMVIGGLLDNRETEILTRVPFIADVPVLGKFFKSMSKSRTNTELVVSVTPVLIDPIPAGVAPPQPKFPSEFLPPNSSVPMQNPEGTQTPSVAPETIPIEKLVDSIKEAKTTKLEVENSKASSSSTTK